MLCSCIVGIGSNENREENILFARRRLEECFPGIRFSIERETAPLGVKNPALFTNLIALLQTECTVEEITSRFKEIERDAGRLPSDKQEEKICLDMDLITHGANVLKPEDLKRTFVTDGIIELFT